MQTHELEVTKKYKIYVESFGEITKVIYEDDLLVKFDNEEILNNEFDIQSRFYLPTNYVENMEKKDWLLDNISQYKLSVVTNQFLEVYRRGEAHLNLNNCLIVDFKTIDDLLLHSQNTSNYSNFVYMNIVLDGYLYDYNKKPVFRAYKFNHNDLLTNRFYTIKKVTEVLRKNSINYNLYDIPDSSYSEIVALEFTYVPENEDEFHKIYEMHTKDGKWAYKKYIFDKLGVTQFERDDD